jgi:hypothetical protein
MAVMTDGAYLEKLYASREALVVAMAEAMANAEVASYSESDGNGSVSASRRSPKELVSALEDIERLIERIESKSGRRARYLSVELPA